MFKVAALVWVILGTFVAGCAITTLLCIGSLSDQAMTLMAPVAVAGFVLAMPLSAMVAKRMMGTFGHP